MPDLFPPPFLPSKHFPSVYSGPTTPAEFDHFGAWLWTSRSLQLAESCLSFGIFSEAVDCQDPLRVLKALIL
jgi:hypothetical protein